MRMNNGGGLDKDRMRTMTALTDDALTLQVSTNLGKDAGETRGTGTGDGENQSESKGLVINRAKCISTWPGEVCQ